MRHRTLLLLLWVCGGCGTDGPTGPGGNGGGGGGGGGGGVAPRLGFVVQPGSATVGLAITPTLRVRLFDATGNQASNATDSITITIANNPGGGTLSGTMTVAAVSGDATFPNLSIDQQGEGYTLTAAAAGFASVVSFPLNVACSCWSTKASMSAERMGLGVSVVNGVVYAIGGAFSTVSGGLFPITYYTSVRTVETYDPVTNSWTTKAAMPTPRYSLGVGVVNGVVYAIGGKAGLFDGPFGPRGGIVEAFDPVANNWTTKAPMPTPRSAIAVGVVNGVVYVVGGADSSGYLATVEAYDPVTNSWTTKTPMPTPRAGLAVAVVNGILYAIGGYNNGDLTIVEAFNPVANTWTTKAPMPTARTELAAAAVDGVLYAIGGFSSSGAILAAVEAYDPAANSWRRTGPMLTSRASLGVGVVNGVLYAVGGRLTYDVGPVPADGELNILEGYDPAQDP